MVENAVEGVVEVAVDEAVLLGMKEVTVDEAVKGINIIIIAESMIAKTE